MIYEKPRVQDLGTVAEHTFYVPDADGAMNIKGGGDPQHLDKKCEWSGGTDPNFCAEPIVER